MLSEKTGRMTSQPTGAIFCGGQSRRMGRPKAGIIFPDGAALIEKVYAAMKSVCQTVVLVGHGEGVPERLSGLKRVEDITPGLGPLGALESLLASGLDSHYLIAPCDLPCVTEHVFQYLVSRRYDNRPVVFNNTGTIEPLIGLYPDNILPAIRQQIKDGRLSMQQLLVKTDTVCIDLPSAYRPLLTNTNTPFELSRVF